MTGAVALIVGSGAPRLELESEQRQTVETPYGAPSSPVSTLTIGGRRLRWLARHGLHHGIAPHEINYRANLWALHALGVTDCIAINAVGAIDPALLPGRLAVPRQLIDYTWGRAASFAPAGTVVHTDFTEPFDAALAARIAGAAERCGSPAVAGVYGVTQGPRLETAAEIDRLERDGCTMVGMTAMPEAVLAREIGIRYAVCAVAVNYAAGREPAAAPIHSQIERYLEEGLGRVAALLEPLVGSLPAGA